MKFTAAIVSSILAYSAAAAPVEPRTDEPGRFTLIALRSGSPVHLSSINANGGSLWIGKETSTYSPLESGCPENDSVTTLAQGADSDSLSMNVVVPGGQQAYISGVDSKFSYTQAHSAYIPEGSVRTGFKYNAPASEGTVGSLTLEGKGFYACPVTEDGKTVYAIESDINGSVAADCIPIGLGASPYTTAAWQYA